MPTMQDLGQVSKKQLFKEMQQMKKEIGRLTSVICMMILQEQPERELRIREGTLGKVGPHTVMNMEADLEGGFVVRVTQKNRVVTASGNPTVGPEKEEPA